MYMYVYLFIVDTASLCQSNCQSVCFHVPLFLKLCKDLFVICLVVRYALKDFHLLFSSRGLFWTIFALLSVTLFLHVILHLENYLVFSHQVW